MARYPNRRPAATMDAYEVIRGPWVSEKSTDGIRDMNVYSFEVAPLANKIDIRQAVERVWPVKVLSVRTVKVGGKVRRMGRKLGRGRDRKKAVVRLAEGQGIDALKP